MIDDTELTEAQKTEQRETVHRLVGAALPAIQQYVIANCAPIDVWGQLSRAEQTRLTVEVTVGYLLGYGLATEYTAETDRWIPMYLPDHLIPDMADALETTRRMTRALRPAPADDQGHDHTGRTDDDH